MQNGVQMKPDHSESCVFGRHTGRSNARVHTCVHTRKRVLGLREVFGRMEAG